MNSIVINLMVESEDRLLMDIGIFKGDEFKCQEISMAYDDEDKDYLYDKSSLFGIIKDNNPFNIIVCSETNVIQRVLYQIDEFRDVLATQGLQLWYKYKIVSSKTIFKLSQPMERQEKLAFLGYFHVVPMLTTLFTQ